MLIPASASSPPTRCDRFTGRTVTANAYARLYVPASRVGDHNLYSCTFDTARRRRVEVPNDTQTWFEPSVRLRGHLAAYALAWGESEEWKSDDEWIVVRDVRRASPLFSTFRRVIPVMGVDGHNWFWRVTGLVLTPRASVAWVACPVRLPAFPRSSRAGCAPGTVKRVVRHEGGNSASAVVLDRGRGVGPGSLRLRGPRLSWTKNGRTRSAGLR
jgi:hypothetical protein